MQNYAEDFEEMNFEKFNKCDKYSSPKRFNSSMSINRDWISVDKDYSVKVQYDHIALTFYMDNKKLFVKKINSNDLSFMFLDDLRSDILKKGFNQPFNFVTKNTDKKHNNLKKPIDEDDEINISLKELILGDENELIKQNHYCISLLPKSNYF